MKSQMTAFNGDASQKQALIESVRGRWLANELAPCAILKWAPDISFYSLNGALIEGEDSEAYEQRTGIPVTLALLCESLMAVATVTTPDASKPVGHRFHLSNRIRAFGLEWLEAIRPGADLAGVQTRFMVSFGDWFLSPSYALGAHLEPGVRAVAERILATWKLELAGTLSDDKLWRDIRKAAVQASEACSDPWCYDLATAVESLAWPAAKIQAEFKQFFMIIVGQLLTWLQQPYLHPDDQANRVALFEAMRALSVAEAESSMDEQATEKLFESRSEWSRALAGRRDATIMDRARAARLKAMEATDPPIRELMDSMLKLLATA
jgi:hypothetical protein